jgi:hypothetical protein
LLQAIANKVSLNLGSSVSVGSIVMDLPLPAAWATRTQTITIQDSTNGTPSSCRGLCTARGAHDDERRDVRQR